MDSFYDSTLSKIESHFKEFGDQACEQATSTFLRMIEMSFDNFDLIFESIVHSFGDFEGSVEYYTAENAFINNSIQDFESDEGYKSVKNSSVNEFQNYSYMNDTSINDSIDLEKMEQDSDLVSNSIFNPFVDKCKDNNVYYHEPFAIKNQSFNLFIGFKEEHRLISIPNYSTESDMLYMVNVDNPAKDGIIRSGDRIQIYSVKHNKKLVFLPDQNAFEITNHSAYSIFTIYGEFQTNITTNQRIYVSLDQFFLNMASFINGGYPLLFAGEYNQNTSTFHIVKPLGKSIPLLLPKNMAVTPNGEYISLSEYTQEKTREGLVFQKQALDIIKSIDGPVSAIVIAGRAREGKSFVMSKLIGRNAPADCFHLGHTVESKTFGIWMWSEPIEMTYGNSKIKVLLLDTEGIDATSATASDDNHIMILSVLFSSIFIYNTTSCPMASNMETLELTTRLTENIVSKTSTSQTSNSECQNIRYLKPNCIWLFRDFNKLIPNIYPSLTSYILNGVCNTVSKKQVIDNFETFQAYSMEAPGVGVDFLKDIVYNEPNLNRKFIEAMYYFVENVIPSTIKPKQSMSGRFLDGNQYVTLILLYLKTIKTHGMIPDIEDKFSLVIENSYNKTIEKCVKIYEQEMNQSLNLVNSNIIYETTKIHACHSQVWNYILNLFNSDSKFERDETVLQMNSKKLFDRIQKVRNQIELVNKQHSIQFCEQIRIEVKQALSNFIIVLDHENSIDDLLQQVDTQMQLFERKCKGPGIDYVRLSLLQDIEQLTMECSQYLTKIQDYESEKLQDMLKVEQEKAKIIELESNQQATLQELSDLKLQNERNLQSLLNQQAQIVAEREKFKVDWEKKESDIKKEYQKQIETFQSNFAKQEETLKKRFDELTVQNQSLQNQINSIPRGGGGGGGGGKRFCLIM